MNWYLKNILIAGGVEDYLQSLGAAPNIIQYIMSQGANSQILVNEFRKNPSLTIEQLQQLVPAQQEQVDPYFDNEKRFANDYSLINKWILVNMRKLRNGASEDKFNMLAPLEQRRYWGFRENIQEIYDWALRSEPRPDISSYTPEQAKEASDEWHRAMAGEGDGKVYEPTNPELIMYGPEWKNPEWQGWTVQKVMSKNDLQTEGSEEMMDHCVGSYCDDVERETSTIFSLRDPQNNPHVTIETGGEKDYNPGTIKQIQGKSNSIPKDIYKAMIKEWISINGDQNGIQKEINAFKNMEEENPYDSPDVHEITELLEKILSGEDNEYGLTYVLDKDIDSIISDLAETGEEENSGYGSGSQYHGDIAEVSPYITNLALMQDLKLPFWPRHSGEWEELRKMPKQSEWKNIQEVEKWAWKTTDEIQEDFYSYGTGVEYPQEEDYEDPAEYEEALTEHDNAEAEIYNEWLKQSVKGGLAKDLLDELKSFREEGLIPSSQEIYNTNKKKEERIKASPRYQNAYDRGREMAQQATASSKNWYKKAQELELTDSQNIKGNGRFYTDTGHDINYGEQNRLLGNDPNEDYSNDNPNMLWIYNNGQIETKPETKTNHSHRSSGNWGLSSYLDRLFTGRYSPSEKIVTVISPHEGMNKYREIPSFIQRALKQKFPEAKQMIRY